MVRREILRQRFSGRAKHFSPSTLKLSPGIFRFAASALFSYFQNGHNSSVMSSETFGRPVLTFRAKMKRLPALGRDGSVIVAGVIWRRSKGTL
jgi:hypothetical protein